MSGKSIKVTRRQALKGASIAGGALAIGHGVGMVDAQTRAQAGWSVDASGLPTYQFASDVPVSTKTPSGKPFGLETDPFFLLGNYRLTLFTYASGLALLVSGARGWVRLNEKLDGAEHNGASLKVKRGSRSQSYKLLGKGGVCASAEKSQRVFGCGYARYTMQPEQRVSVERVLSVPPSDAADLGEPAVVINVRITNNDRVPITVEYTETVLSHPHIVIDKANANGGPAVEFVTSADQLPAGRGVISASKATAEDPTVLTPPDIQNRFNLYPESLALLAPSSASQGVEFSHRSVSGGAVELAAQIRATLPPGASKDIVLVIALKAHDASIEGPLRFADSLKPTASGVHFDKEWSRLLSTFSSVPDEKLRRELTWDGHALLAMATHAAYYGHTFIPQGMTYDYFIDLTAAPRDHLQHSMAAAYFAKDLSRSTILYTLCKMTFQGEIKYTDFGFGETSNSAWNTSDQQLYLFQALGEYLRITRDWSILEAQTTYLPAEAHFQGTTLEKLERAFSYLRDEVSVGPHGLVRLMNSDWSDMVYVDTPVMRYFGSAESQMNSAMVMAVIPELVKQLTIYGQQKGGETGKQIARLTKGILLYLDKISKAMLRDMEGRTFAKRIYLDANTSMGDDNMHVEPQSFLLQAAAYPVDRKRTLWREVQKRILDDEVLGPRQREKPVVGGGMQPGTSENGGFWYSLAGQMVVGLATFDKGAALGLLDRMTFGNFARHYPDYWVGHWTAPDTINAVFCGDLAGLPRPDNDGLWCQFAGYCAHAHAWPIYSYYRIKDFA